jgi:hypothetical protein
MSQSGMLFCSRPLHRQFRSARIIGTLRPRGPVDLHAHAYESLADIKSIALLSTPSVQLVLMKLPSENIYSIKLLHLRFKTVTYFFFVIN